MRWKKRPKPKIGDTRIVKRFLLFPKNLNNDVVWLEVAHIRQCIYHGDYFGYTWKDQEWVDIKQEFIEKLQRNYEEGGIYYR